MNRADAGALERVRPPGRAGATVHRLPQREGTSETAGILPPIDAVDVLEEAALVDFATQAAALLERARARLHTIPKVASTAPALDEYLTAEQVAQLLNAEPSWIYRHTPQLGGVKLDGILRFPRRRLEAYLARQARLGA